MATTPRGLPRFVLLALAWLPVTFAVWYIAAPILLYPAQLIAEGVLRLGFADLVRAVDADGANAVVMTTLRPGQAAAGGKVSVDVNLLLYSFGLPLFVALTLAARDERRWRALAVGYAVQLPFVAWGAVADFLKNVAITAPPLVTSQTGFSALGRDMIAYAYQFGSLILPAVVPAVAWVLTHRAFLERMRATRGTV